MVTSFAKFRFHLLLLLIAIFGLWLRFIDYDRVPPFDVTKDEFFYPWAGMSLIQTGVPKAWSLFEAYPTGEIVYKWGTWYRIVSPWVEKPPLYSLLTGSWMIANGARDLFDVRLSVLRIIPITLSFFTIISVGFLGKSFFGNRVGLLSATLYATVPTIVMANRVSLVENLLTPIVLLAILIFLKDESTIISNKLKPFVIGFLLGLATLTKNIGIALPVLIISILLIRKNWRDIFIITTITFLFTIIHPLIGAYYDWNLFQKVIKEYQTIHAFAGLPELLLTIFRFPIVGHQWDRIFPDGSILAGYILLFSSPFWVKTIDFIKEKKDNNILLIGFPLIYVTLLALLESGGTPYSYFGWHVYPLFPFLMILVAKALYDVWQYPNLLQLLFFYLLIGFSTVRFFLLLAPQFQQIWQWILGIILVFLVGGFVLKINYQRTMLTVSFIIFLIINFLVIINLNRIYPGFPQPPY